MEEKIDLERYCLMLDDQISQISRNKLVYNIFIFLLTLLELFSIYSSAHSINLQSYTVIISGIMGILGIVIFIWKFSFKKILFLLALFIVWWSSNFNNFWIVPICISVGFVNFSLCGLINAYCISNIITLIITVLLAVVGLAPMKNSADGILSLGFATESALGLVLTLISFVFVLELVKFGKKTKFYLFKIIFIVFSFILKIVVLEDRTMTWTFLVFLLFILLFRLNKKTFILLMKLVGVIIPYFLTYISWMCTTNYGMSNFLYKVDKLFSYRLLMWNWYYQKVSLKLFPNTFRLSNFNYWGTIDGSYALLLLQYGILMTMLTCSMLAICNFLLLKYKYFGVFCIMFSLELAAFVENILQFYTGAIPLILALLTFYIGWIKNSSDIEIIEE